jgi:hypothetical protein
MSLGMTIAIERSEVADLVYGVLAHLDLGDDAASLFDARLVASGWVPELRDAYLGAPDRVAMHGWGLWYRQVAELEAALAVTRVSAAERRLVAGAQTAFSALRASNHARFVADAQAHAQRRTQFERDAVPCLSRLREALYERIGSPPALRVIDCPALAGNGRATEVAGERVVAVSLADPLALVQVLHEEIHPVTDGLVGEIDEPSTQAGSPGFSAHMAMEYAAIDVGEDLVAVHAPELAEAYGQWRARLRLPV